MDVVTLRVHRLWSDTFEDTERRTKLHLDRSRLIHEMVDELDLAVVDWGDTDSSYPREIVEILIEVASTLAAAGISAWIQAWWAQRKVKNVEIVGPDGQAYGLADLNPSEMAALGKYLWESRAPKDGASNA